MCLARLVTLASGRQPGAACAQAQYVRLLWLAAMAGIGLLARRGDGAWGGGGVITAGNAWACFRCVDRCGAYGCLTRSLLRRSP